MTSGPGGALTPAERDRLSAIRGAESLAALRDVVDVVDEHRAYVAAKRAWRRLRAKELGPADDDGGLAGSSVTVDGRTFHVHGVTHTDTAAERSFVRDHVRSFRDDGAAVYVEQGIRPMYFDDMPGVCEMDDYRWAMARCRALGLDSHVEGLADFDSLGEDLDSLANGIRGAVFSLIDGGDDAVGSEIRRVIGDLASDFLTDHESMATGEDYESFALAREAASAPSKLPALQRYYATAFLPQPLEREWLRRHDPELELLTHARNERQADYVVYHAEEATEVHLVVGAAHQPGVRYYLERHRDGLRSAADYERIA